MICTDGSIYTTLSDAESASKTPVAMIAYVSGDKGLTISLHAIEAVGGFYGRYTIPLTFNASGDDNNGKTAIQWADEWNTTTPVTNATWRLPSSTDWENMIIGCGGEAYPYNEIQLDKYNNPMSPIKHFGNLHTMLQNLSSEIGICYYETLKENSWTTPSIGFSTNYWTSTNSAIFPSEPYVISFNHVDDYAIGPDLVSNYNTVRPCLAFDVIAPVPVTSLTLDATKKSVMVGNAVALTATITPNDASDKRVTWTTADAYVKFYADAECTVPTGGLTNLHTIYVQGTSAGVATVTVTSYADNTKTASCQVTVNNPTNTLSENVDNSTFIKDHKGQAYDITLTRTLKAGGWNTFSVPFNLPHDQVLSVFGANVQVRMLRQTELTGAVLKLTFADVWNMSAGTAYLVKVESDVVNPTFANVTISDNIVSEYDPMWCSHADFVPVINPVNVAAGDKNKLFVISGNNPTHPNTDGKILGFRGYIQLKGTAAASARTFSLDIDGETTAIYDLQIEGSTSSRPAIFDLQGRKVESPRGKLYIIDGKKVIK